MKGNNFSNRLDRRRFLPETEGTESVIYDVLKEGVCCHMALRMCVLASGSSGNCTFIGSDKTFILIDAGISGKKISERLGEIGVEVSGIAAICLSHEHDDHTSSIGVLYRRHDIPIYANSGTIQALKQRDALGKVEWNVFTTGSAFEVGDITIEPFSVPHDAMDPVGFIISADKNRVGVITDLGISTTLIRERLRSCQAIVVESNHDTDLLEDANRPWGLKQRIKGRQGHLSNEKAAEMVVEIAGPGLQHVFLAHLSSDCNTAKLARTTMTRALKAAGHDHVRVSVTFPDRISDIWMEQETMVISSSSC